MQAFLVDMENKPGELARVAEALGAKGVNILGGAGTACGDGGRVALTVADEEAARTALRDANCKFTEIEIVQAALRNEPGSLGRAARRLADAGVNIEAIMPTGMQGNDVTVAFATDNPATARQVIETAGKVV